MKKITMLMVALASFATIISCGGNDKTPTEVKESISATPQKLECLAAGGPKTFTLKASGDWTISDVPTFVTVDPLTGKAGDKITITVTFNPNTTDATIEGALKAKLNANDAKSATIELSSLGKGVALGVDYENIQNYMVDVEGGTYEMSTEGIEGNTMADLNENGDDPYHIRHQVTLDSYMICKYEMTQETWKRIMGTEPYVNGGSKPNPTTKIVSLKVAGGPVVYNTWLEAIEFCNKLSEDQKLAPYYKIEGNKVTIIDLKGKGYRLPTESEWEYAARGGQKTQGFDYPGFSELAELDNFIVHGLNCSGKVKPVGSKKANELGLHDMAGNVWEQVYDLYDVYPVDPTTNPTGPTEGSQNTIRGASWYGEPTDPGSAWSYLSSVRYYAERVYGDDDQGFRIARYK